MSNLHKMKIKHQGMSPAEKMACNCELCKGLNVNKSRRKIEVPEPKIEDITQKVESTRKFISENPPEITEVRNNQFSN